MTSRTQVLALLCGSALVGGVLVASCADSAQPVAPTTSAVQSPSATADVAGGPPASAVIQFGSTERGSPFPGPSGHDASGHAHDKMYPRNIVIERGGSITFDIAPTHQVAVYRAGTEAGDISLANLETLDLSPGPVIPNFKINDPNGRLALSQPATILGPGQFTTPPGTFDQPGRYFVMCTTLPHFTAADMWGWVTVK